MSSHSSVRPQILIGLVLLCRAWTLSEHVHPPDIDPRFISELSSPGLSRAAKLTFESLTSESGVPE
jgi:hypothetical protein